MAASLAVPLSLCNALSKSRKSSAREYFPIYDHSKHGILSFNFYNGQVNLKSYKFDPSFIHTNSKKINKSCIKMESNLNSNLNLEEKYQVVLTREKGKNGKMMKLLEKHSISFLEFPLIEHIDGPERKELPIALKENNFDWIIITSPEAANVFLKGWKEAGFPKVNIAVVGEGTGKMFENELFENEFFENKHFLNVGFTPSKATGKVLAVELPEIENGNKKILYPSSKKAGSDIQTGLEERGFDITRLNTYSTEKIKDVDFDLFSKAKNADVLTFASPSSVKAWADLVKSENWSAAIACIGQTSADAATCAGFQNIFFPDSPGMDGWLNSIIEALESKKVTK